MTSECNICPLGRRIVEVLRREGRPICCGRVSDLVIEDNRKTRRALSRLVEMGVVHETNGDVTFYELTKAAIA